MRSPYIALRVSAATKARKITGETIFSVTPEMLNGFITAPDEIREDPLFGMLAADGSLETGVDERQRKILEKDPVAEVTAEGKKKRTGGS